MPSNSGESLLILVVEDDDDMRDTLQVLLEDEGIVVRAAAGGNAALALLAEGLRPGLVLLDLHMPIMDGWDFHARFVEAGLGAIPVIVTSGVPAPEPPWAAAVLAKPFDLDAVLTLVRRYRGA